MRGGRITSYNVCYTKLLRPRGDGGLNPEHSGTAAPFQAVNEGVLDQGLENEARNRGLEGLAAYGLLQGEPSGPPVITSYSIHYTKLYEAGWSRYRTPVRNLWLCASGAHPGGGIMGAPGALCAKAMLGARGGAR